MLIPLAEHLHRVSNYWSHVTNPSDPPHTSPSPADVLPPPDGMEKIWIVSIVPHMFLHNVYHDDIFTNLKLRCVSKIYHPGLDSGWPHGHTPSTSPWPCHYMRYGPSNLPPHSSTITPRLCAWLVVSAIRGSYFLASSLCTNWTRTSSHTRMVYSVKTWDLPSRHCIWSFLRCRVGSPSSPCSGMTTEALEAPS